MWNTQSLGAAAGVVVAAVIKLLPSIGPLDATGQSALAIIALAVVWCATDVLNAGITALLALGLLMIAGVPSSVALSGYATGAFWILVPVLFFGTAMEKTGLARRISYRILLLFPPTYAGILSAFMLIGFVLTLGIPSMTVRTAIMVPIAFALVQAVGLPLPSPGAALIVLGAFEMAVLPGCAVLTGSLWGPFIAGLFATAQLPLTWFGYARVMVLPTVVWCGLLIAANLVVMRPSGKARLRGSALLLGKRFSAKPKGYENAPAGAFSAEPGTTGGFETGTTVMNREAARAEIATLGRMGRPELFTAIIVSTAVAAWAAQPWLRVPAEAIGMVALAALFAARVLVPADIGTGIPWALVLFIGGMLSVTTVMTAYRINAWLGSFIVPAVQPFVGNPFSLVLALSGAVAAVRFLDPLGFITIAAFFLPLAAFVSGAGVSPLVLVAIILLPVHVFWFNYQNIWVTMTEGISKKSAYTDADRMRLATVFFVVTIAALWVAVAYWRLAGLL